MNTEEMTILRLQDRTIATLREQLAAAEARVMELETCNQLNATEMQRYQIQSARLESERDALKAELETANRRAEGFKQATIRLGGKCYRVNTLRILAVKRCDALKAAVRKIEAEHQAGCNVAASMMRDLEERGEGLRRELATAVAHNHDLEDAIAMGEQTVEVLEARAQDLQISLNHQRERARQAVYAFDHQVKEVESLEAYWEQDRDRWRFAAGRLKTAFKHERDSLKARVQELEKHVQDAWKAAGAQHKEMIDAQAQIVVKDRVLGKVLNVPKCPECGTRRCAVCWGHGGLHTEDCDARAALANGTECDEDEVEIRIADYLANVIDLTGAGEPNCATCRREDCWPDCARFYDKPVGGTGEVKGDGGTGTR